MKSHSMSHPLVVPAVLVALFAAGALAARALTLPLPAALVGLAFVLAGLRIGVILAAVEKPAASLARPLRPDTHGGPSLRAANG
jgi:putative effector of murein hydrolase LrgA (UPF0299 family)